MKRAVPIAGAILLVALFATLYRPPIPVERLTEQYSDEQSDFLDLDGFRVHHRVVGNGVPLLLIHGTSSSLHTWAGWQELLRDEWRTIAIDMPGGGLTDPAPNEDYSIATYIDVLDRFIEATGIDSFHMAGNSLGGHIAWAYALRGEHRDRLGRLVLVDPSGIAQAGMEKPAVFKLAQIDVLFALIEHINVRPFVRKSLGEVFLDDAKVDQAIIDRYADLMRRPGNRNAFFNKVRQLEMEEADVLAGIDVPVLVQWGAEDAWIPPSLADVYAREIEDVTVHMYEAGHIPMEELPDETAADVRTFLMP